MRHTQTPSPLFQLLSPMLGIGSNIRLFGLNGGAQFDSAFAPIRDSLPQGVSVVAGGPMLHGVGQASTQGLIKTEVTVSSQTWSLRWWKNCLCRDCWASRR